MSILGSRSRCLLIAAAVLICGCASNDVDQQVKRLQARATYEQGIKHLEERRVALGMAALQEAIQLEPDNALYRNALGIVQLDLGRRAEAQELFQKALELDPNFAEAYLNLGVAKAEQGKYEEAVTSYKKALSYPTYTSPEVAYHNLGFAYLRLKQFKEAEESFRIAIRLDAQRPSAHYWLGVALVELGRMDEAKGSFRTARDLDPTSFIGRAAGQSLKNLGDGG